MSDDSRASRASVLTPRGRGAVAVVAAEGPAAIAAVDAHFRAANGRPIAEQPIGRVAFGHWHSGEGQREEVIVCRCDPWRLEVHCHGGVAAPQRILDALAAKGCRVEAWQDSLRYSAGDILEAEAEIALTAATTRRTAAIVLDQRRALSRRKSRLRDGNWPRVESRQCAGGSAACLQAPESAFI